MKCTGSWLGHDPSAPPPGVDLSGEAGWEAQSVTGWSPWWSPRSSPSPQGPLFPATSRPRDEQNTQVSFVHIKWILHYSNIKAQHSDAIPKHAYTFFWCWIFCVIACISYSKIPLVFWAISAKIRWKISWKGAHVPDRILPWQKASALGMGTGQVKSPPGGLRAQIY